MTDPFELKPAAGWAWHRRPMTLRHTEKGHLAAVFRSPCLVDPFYRIAMRDDVGSSLPFRRILSFLKWAQSKCLIPTVIDQAWPLFGAMMKAAGTPRKETG